MRIHACGNHDGPPLVLLHGLAMPHPARAGGQALAVAGSAARTDFSSIGLVLGSVLRRSPVRRWARPPRLDR